MAPKGGGRGGGGGGGRGSGVDIDCNASAFKSGHAKAIIAFAALFGIVYLVLACMVPLRRRRAALNLERPGKKNRSWSFLRLGIYFQVLATIVFIASFVTAQCVSVLDAQPGLQAARGWLEAIAILTLYGIILVGLCKKMHEVSGSLLPKVVTIAHSIYFGLLVLLDLVALSISTALANVDRGTSPDTLNALFHASKGLTATFDVLAFIGMGIATASMLLALLRSSQLKEGVLKVWVGLLILSSIGMTVLELAYYATFTLLRSGLTPEADVAYYVLRCLFYAVMFASLLFIHQNQYIATGGAQIGAPAMAPPQQAPPANYDPNMAEPYKPEDNTGYGYQYAPNPSPAPPSPQPNNAAYPAPYSPTNNMGQYPQNAVSPPPPQPYNNNPAATAPYNGNNVNYTPVATPPPPQPYYH